MKPLTRRARLILTLSGVAYAAMGPGLAQAHDHKDGAKTCYVDKIRYSNNGGYSVAGLNLKYVKPNGNNYEFSWAYYPALNKEVDIGQSMTVDLNHFNGKEGDGSVTGLSSPPLREGDEVWISLPITLGEAKSCHKDGHRLVYRKDVGKTMKFKSAGTTLNGNRCKVAGNMDDMCYTGE